MSEENFSPPSFSSGRKFNAGFGVFIAVLAALAIVVEINYISARHLKRFNLSSDVSQQLTPATHLVLKSLTNEVKITVLFDPEEDLFSAISTLLKEYSLASPKLKIDFVDFRVNAERAGRVKAEYHLSDEQKNMVIFSCNSKPKFVTQAELSEYDFSNLLSGKSKEIKRKAFKGEQLFTSAILTVSDPTPPKVYFLFGHGEHDPGTSSKERDYGKFATLLIIGGAVTKISREEQDKLEKYLNQGGRLLLLVPLRSESGLENLLARWGVELGDAQVVDRGNSKADSYVLVGSFGSHPVVKPLGAGAPLFLVSPRLIGKKSNGLQSADAPQVTELAMTGPRGIAVADYRRGVKPNLIRDRQGEIPLMVAVEKGSLKGVNLDRGSTRMIVVGDSDFLENALIDNGGNRDFAWHAVNWLLDRSQLLGGIGPRPVVEYPPIVFPDEKLKHLRFLLLGVIPGAVLMLGVVVWFRRRH